MAENPNPIPDLDYADFPIQVQWASEGGRVVQVSRSNDDPEIQARAQRALNLAMGTIRAMAYRVSRAVKSLEDQVRPDEAEIEFGVNLDAEAGALLAKAGAGAQITVTLKWKVETPERPKIIVESH